MATILTKTIPSSLFSMLRKVDYDNISGATLGSLKNNLYQYQSHFPIAGTIDTAVNYKNLNFPIWLQDFVNQVDWTRISKFQLTLMETFLKQEIAQLPKLK